MEGEGGKGVRQGGEGREESPGCAPIRICLTSRWLSIDQACVVALAGVCRGVVGLVQQH